MVKVAIAGGTGNVGRHLVDGILAAKKHELVVLSRAPSPELEKLGVDVITVSYTDPAALESALQGVHTLISTVAIPQGNALVATHLALLDAAKKAGVSRFIPPEFGVECLPDDPVEFFRFKAQIAKAVTESGLEYTLFENGIFMNYLASGTKGMGHFPVNRFVVDVEKCTAMVPGDGTSTIVFTRVEDAAAFVAALLDLPRWPEVSKVMGSRITWNNLLAIAEAIRGKKFAVEYLSEEVLEERIKPDAPNPIVNMAWQMLLEIIRTNRFAYEKANLNELLPEIEPMSVEDFLGKWWA